MTQKLETEGTKVTRYRVVIKGIVQGVGFRPFVYKLARFWNIKGSVLNSGEGLIIEVEGADENISGFLRELKEMPPKLSRISHYQQREMPAAGYKSFAILASDPGAEKEALIPPDISTCTNCAQDIFNPDSRHYGYPFTNCTNCGPRFTIIHEVPYDRLKTSMSSFPMCDNCAAGYHDPPNRWFHAQPVACPACGPHVEVVDRSGKKVAGKENWLEVCWDILHTGKILALKSLGGYHLACDAMNKESIAALRRRKGREARPFAVMCRDLKTAQKYCFINKDEAGLLASPQAPIVILRKRPAAGLPEELAPGLKTLGMMLPYTPLHLLLFSGPFSLLVMTSGNYSSLPLVKDNSRAIGDLGNIADYFLWHNRKIINRCDDSLVRVIDGETHIIRRSRGYVPYPIPVSRTDPVPVILGVGGEMKNCFCLLKNGQAFMSQHIGEIDSLEGEENLFSSLKNFQKLIGATPAIVAYDTHPGYASAQIARRVPAQTYIETQHHHSHMASCMAENGLENEKVIGAILDGTGYGTDGRLWGFEILTGNYTGFQRVCHLAYVPLPGGEIAIRQPWRTASAYLLTFLGREGMRSAVEIFKDKNLNILEKMIGKGFNSPLSSGCGRLFDAVSALLGICLENTYEGQAAIELGEAVLEEAEGNLWPYPFEIKDGIILPAKMLAEILRERASGVPVEIISTRFHKTLANIIVQAAAQISLASGLEKVALSGGTWQNKYLFMLTKKMLESKGFQVLYHRQAPANDGGIALGQAMIAHWRW